MNKSNGELTLLSNFKTLRILAWLIDSVLWYVVILLLLVIGDMLLRVNELELAAKLGFQTTITDKGEIINAFVEFWNHYLSYVLWCILIASYLLLSKLFSKKWLKGSSIGKWLMKLTVQKDQNNFKFLINFLFLTRCAFGN